jgi:hypothetical protein
MFASVTTLTTSQIARVNITTGVMTPIGSPTAVAAGVTAIAISPTGDLFAVDAITDNLYRFNKTTGVAILVGPTGSNINTLTDIQFDYTDSLAYTINNNQLRVSSSPGGGTLVCTFVGNTPIAFAIKPPSNLIGIISGQTIPLEFFIEQNYPNPFNPTTKIKFGISKSANVKLTVYDVLGKEVAVLVNEDKLANTYEVQFDASAFPSGVYFYKIAYGEFTSTRKMLLVK